MFMPLLIALFVGLLALACAATFWNLRRAVDGEEDDAGFHAKRSSDEMGAVNTGELNLTRV